MSGALPPDGPGPETWGAEPVYFFDGQAIVPPPGTKPPPRPAGLERQPSGPGAQPGWGYLEFEGAAIVPPPGTTPPPRRGSVFRVAVPGTDPAAVEAVAELLRRVQDVVNGLPGDPGGVDALRRAADELPRAG